MAALKLIGVSGLSGLIGTELAQVKSGKVELVRSISFSSISNESIDLEIERLTRLGVTGFLHLAWPAGSSRQDYKTSSNNFDALKRTIAVRAACKKWGIKFFGVGTGIDKSIDPSSNYSIAKYKARQSFLGDILTGRIAWIRPHYVFNNQDWPKFIYSSGDEPLLIRDDTPRDFIHIKDVALGIMWVLEHDLRGEIDIGCGVLRKPSDLCRVLGIKLPPSSSLGTPGSLVSKFPELPQSVLTKSGWLPKHTQEVFGEKNGI